MFTAIKNTKVYEQVIIQIKDMISNGFLKKGDKLPSERELSARLKVSRTSIREALRSLEMIGLLECRQGEGNFVRENFENSLFEPLSIMFMLNKNSEKEIFELRRVIEVETAALAAKTITNEEIEELRELLDMMSQCKDEEQKAKMDKQFHYKIAKASGNLLIVTILNTISTLIDAFIKRTRAEILKNEENSNIIVSQHRQIVDALSRKDDEEAAAIMRLHMELINREAML